VSVSRAKALLRLAQGEPDRLRRHLQVAAAFREILTDDPIVVGGTAEEYWTAAEYHETDLDLCASLRKADEGSLEKLGFRREGRHFVHPRINVAAEFPEAMIDGDESRTVEEPVGPGRARIIGVDDLYLDRLRQATIAERREGIEFHSALAVVAACDELIDWSYVGHRLKTIRLQKDPIGDTMRRLDSKIRSRVRRKLSEPEPQGRDPGRA
jgi:hypothetical protein